MAAHHHKPCLVCGKPIQGKPSYVAKRRFCSPECCTQFQCGQSNPNWKGGKVEVTCHYCGSTVYKQRSQLRPVMYCNKECFSRAAVGKNIGEDNPRWKGGSKASKRRYRDKIGVVPRSSRPPRLCKGCGLPGVRKGRRYHPECTPQKGNKSYIVRCIDCGVERRYFASCGKAPERCSQCAYQRRGGSNNANWKGGITPINQQIRASDEYKEWRRAVFERDQYTCVWCGQVGGKLHADHIKPFSKFPELRLDIENGRTLCVACHEKTDTYMAKVKKRRPAHTQLNLNFGEED